MLAAASEGYVRLYPDLPKSLNYIRIWEFPIITGTFFGVLLIRILLFRVLYIPGPKVSN